MYKTPEILTDLIRENPLLEFGLAYRLFNLSQLAKYLHPIVETRAKRDVRPQTIVTALSRLQSQKIKRAPKAQDFHVDNVSVTSGLGTRTYHNSPEVRAKLSKIMEVSHAKKAFFHHTESTHEITIFYDASQIGDIKIFLPFQTKYTNENITCVTVRFGEHLFHVPGLLFSLMQKINLQNVNIIDISSTFTEFNFYVDQKDTKITFETLYDSFIRK